MIFLQKSITQSVVCIIKIVNFGIQSKTIRRYEYT